MKTLFKTTSAIIALAGSMALVSASANAANIGGLASAGVAAGDGFIVKAASKPRANDPRDFTYSRSQSDLKELQRRMSRSQAISGRTSRKATPAARSASQRD